MGNCSSFVIGWLRSEVLDWLAKDLQPPGAIDLIDVHVEDVHPAAAVGLERRHGFPAILYSAGREVD